MITAKQLTRCHGVLDKLGAIGEATMSAEGPNLTVTLRNSARGVKAQTVLSIETLDVMRADAPVLDELIRNFERAVAEAMETA